MWKSWENNPDYQWVKLEKELVLLPAEGFNMCCSLFKCVMLWQFFFFFHCIEQNIIVYCEEASILICEDINARTEQ